MLWHKVSKKGLEVDKEKLDIIGKLPPLKNIKEVRSFLGHCGFSRRFMKDFSKIYVPLCSLLCKDAKFEFDEKCLEGFEKLKKALVTAPIIRSPNWELPFEVMTDANDRS